VTDQHNTQHDDDLAVFLVQHSRGEAHAQASSELRELLNAVQEHGRKGSLTLKINVEPPKGHVDGAPVLVSVESELKAPRPIAPPAMYFVDDDGRPTRNDPRQTAAFDVRDLPTARTEIKDIQK
jgi:hypothetical protein